MLKALLRLYRKFDDDMTKHASTDLGEALVLRQHDPHAVRIATTELLRNANSAQSEDVRAHALLQLASGFNQLGNKAADHALPVLAQCEPLLQKVSPEVQRTFLQASQKLLKTAGNPMPQQKALADVQKRLGLSS